MAPSDIVPSASALPVAAAGSAHSSPRAASAIPGDDREHGLVDRLRAGDERAFVDLIELYGGRCLAVARRFMKTEQDAEDAVQDAFLSAFKNLPRFDGGSQLGTWLHRIVINACLMRLRTQRRRPESSIEPLLPTFQADGHQTTPSRPWPEDPSLGLERAELQRLVRARIDDLPEGYRNVLLLRDIEGLDTEAAAAALGMTATAVKTRLHRARQALRNLLEQSLRPESHP